MKKIALFAACLYFASFAQASYPSVCQLKMLHLAVESFDSDLASYEFFDFESVGFDYSVDGEPAVIFNGRDSSSRQTCQAKVIMSGPIEAPGCPKYQVKSISEDCP